MQQRQYSVYMLTCRVTGESYIGITCQRPELRWRGGKAYGGKIGQAIQKYGWDNFDTKILENAINPSDAANRERFYIALYDTYLHGLNSSEGGEVFSEVDIRQRAFRQKGRKLNADTKKKISTANKGRVFSESHIANLRASHQGNTGYWAGKKRDAETIRKIQQARSKQLRCIETGVIYDNLTHASIETGLSKSCINKSCNGLVNNPRCGLHFEFV